MKKTTSISQAFSLVEVVLAIGIVSFCLVPLVALLPIGLNAIKASRDTTSASVAIEQIAIAMRNATAVTGSPTNYRAQGAYQEIVWEVGSTEAAYSFNNISAGGFPVTNISEKKLSARVVVYPPTSQALGGRALVSIAWPNRATWNEGTTNWANAQGSVSAWIHFIPNR